MKKWLLLILISGAVHAEPVVTAAHFNPGPPMVVTLDVSEDGYARQVASLVAPEQEAGITYLLGELAVQLPAGFELRAVILRRVANGLPAVMSEDPEPVELWPIQDRIDVWVTGEHPTKGWRTLAPEDLSIIRENNAALLGLWDGYAAAVAAGN